jgi:WD40 repeat protein
MLELTGHTRPVVSLAFAPDGRTLASAGLDGTARLWDLAGGACRAKIQSGEERAFCVAFAPDGKSLAVGYGGNTGGAKGIVQVWDLDPLRRRTKWQAANQYYVRSLAFTPDGRELLTAGYDDNVWRYDLNHRGGPKAWKAYRTDVGPVYAVAVSPDGQTVAALTHPAATVHLWGAGGRTGEGFKCPSEQGYALAFAPDGRSLACALGRQVAVWDLLFQRPPPLWAGHAGDVLAVAFAPDGRTLASAGQDGEVKLWDPAAGEVRAGYDWQIGELGAVAFAPDGLTAAAGGAGSVVVWDVTDSL